MRPCVYLDMRLYPKNLDMSVIVLVWSATAAAPHYSTLSSTLPPSTPPLAPSSDRNVQSAPPPAFASAPGARFEYVWSEGFLGAGACPPGSSPPFGNASLARPPNHSLRAPSRRQSSSPYTARRPRYNTRFHSSTTRPRPYRPTQAVTSSRPQSCRFARRWSGVAPIQPAAASRSEAPTPPAAPCAPTSRLGTPSAARPAGRPC